MAQLRDKETEFDILMLNPMNKTWYEQAPVKVRKMVEEYPWKTYIVKEGAPYGVSCPGQKVHLHSYKENGEVGVVVLANEKIPAALEHEKYLYEKHKERMKLSLEQVHGNNTLVAVDPVWLEPVAG